MNTYKGFASVTVLIAIAALALIGGGAYVATHPEMMRTDGTESETENQQEAAADASGKIGIDWEFIDAGEKDSIPYTRVMLNGHHVGDFQGSCSEVGAEGGVDGKGLLIGELAAAQCWFAGGGDEIGVFAREDAGVDVMVGKLEEPIEGGAGFRGDFEMKSDIRL